MKTNKNIDRQDKQLRRLHNEIDSLQRENAQLKEKLTFLESISNTEVKRNMEQAEQLFYDKLSEAAHLKEHYQQLIHKQNQLISTLKKKYIKQTNTAIAEFKDSISCQ